MIRQQTPSLQSTESPSPKRALSYACSTGSSVLRLMPTLYAFLSRAVARAVALAVAVLFITGMSACGKNSPILVGFSGPLEGKFSDIGIHGRNGAQLAIEHINNSGGINGRQLTFLAVHDGTTEDAVISADSDLLRKGAVAIIGHMTSQQSIYALPEVEKQGAVLISPTTSTPVLSGKKDAFFRVISESSAWARHLAQYARKNSSDRILAIYDIDNKAYTQTFTEAFTKEFRNHGGTVVDIVPVSSSGLAAWEGVIDAARHAEAKSIFLSLSSRDVATLARLLHLSGINIPLYCSPWSFTRDVLLEGGKHVEGLTASISYAPDNNAPRFLKFKEDYMKRFGWEPSFSSAFSYDAVLLLAEALKLTGGERKGLAEALLATGTINGVVSNFAIDEYGDVQRKPFILTIQDGKMVTLE